MLALRWSSGGGKEASTLSVTSGLKQLCSGIAILSLSLPLPPLHPLVQIVLSGDRASGRV